MNWAAYEEWSDKNTKSFNPDEWIHLKLTIDESIKSQKLKLYVNGDIQDNGILESKTIHLYPGQNRIVFSEHETQKEDRIESNTITINLPKSAKLELILKQDENKLKIEEVEQTVGEEFGSQLSQNPSI